jgi:hypothetical protein
VPHGREHRGGIVGSIEFCLSIWATEELFSLAVPAAASDL